MCFTAKFYSFLIPGHVVSLAIMYRFFALSVTAAVWRIQSWTNSAPKTEGTTKH